MPVDFWASVPGHSGIVHHWSDAGRPLPWCQPHGRIADDGPCRTRITSPPERRKCRRCVRQIREGRRPRLESGHLVSSPLPSRSHDRGELVGECMQRNCFDDAVQAGYCRWHAPRQERVMEASPA